MNRKRKIKASLVYYDKLNETSETYSNGGKKCQLQNMSRNLLNYMSYYLRETPPYPGVFNYANYNLFEWGAPLENVEPVLPGFEPVFNDIGSFKYDFEPHHDCSPANSTTLFVAINLTAGNVNRRNVIR